MTAITKHPKWFEVAQRGDGLEVAPVIFGDDFTERTDKRSEASAWGVYVHLPEGGVEWIVDFDGEDEAMKYAKSLVECYPNLCWHGISLCVAD